MKVYVEIKVGSDWVHTENKVARSIAFEVMGESLPQTMDSYNRDGNEYRWKTITK